MDLENTMLSQAQEGEILPSLTYMEDLKVCKITKTHHRMITKDKGKGTMMERD